MKKLVLAVALVLLFAFNAFAFTTVTSQSPYTSYVATVYKVVNYGSGTQTYTTTVPVQGGTFQTTIRISGSQSSGVTVTTTPRR